MPRYERDRLLESTIERGVKDWCDKNKILFWKLQAPPRGIPDRLVVAPGGIVAFIEFKRPGMKLTHHQHVIMTKLKNMGFKILVADNKYDAIQFIMKELLEC